MSKMLYLTSVRFAFMVVAPSFFTVFVGLVGVSLVYHQYRALTTSGTTAQDHFRYWLVLLCIMTQPPKHLFFQLYPLSIADRHHEPSNPCLARRSPLINVPLAKFEIHFLPLLLLHRLQLSFPIELSAASRCPTADDVR